MKPFYLGLLLLAGGCDDTAVELVIHAQLRIPEQLDAFCLQLAAGNKPQFSRHYPLDSVSAGNSHSLTVLAGEQYDDQFLVMLRGERRGWQTTWLRQRAKFDRHDTRRMDLFLNRCVGVKGSGTFKGAGSLGGAKGTQAQAMPVAYAPAQVVLLWPGKARRVAIQRGTLGPAPGGTPTVGKTGPHALLSADLDGDCDLDLLLLGQGGPTLWRNSGNGAFESVPGALPKLAAFTSAAAADLNADRALDLVLGSPGGTALLLGNPGRPGTFKQASGQLPSGGLDSVTGVALGFVNKDPHPDIVLARGDKDARSNLVLLNSARGDARFAKATKLPQKSKSKSVTLGDLDGDGYHELIFGNDGAASRVIKNRLGVLDDKNPVALADTAKLRVTAVLARDLDNDCDVDLVLASPGGSRLLLNKGTGNLTSSALADGKPARNLAAVDLDGDGRLDLVLAGDSGATWVRQK